MRDGVWCHLPSEEPSNLQLVSGDDGATFLKFPYPLENLKGTVDMNLVTKLVQLEATGEAGTGTVLVKGTWQGKGKQADCRFDIEATAVTLDENVIKALPPQFQKLAREFQRHRQGQRQSAMFATNREQRNFTTSITLTSMTRRSAGKPFPYALDNVTGYLDIYPKSVGVPRGQRHAPWRHRRDQRQVGTDS